MGELEPRKFTRPSPLDFYVDTVLVWAKWTIIVVWCISFSLVLFYPEILLHVDFKSFIYRMLRAEER